MTISTSHSRSKAVTDDREALACICGIRAQNEGADVLLSLLTKEGEKRQLTITMEQYLDLHIKKGEALSFERMEALEEAAAFCGALRCGENLLAYAPSPTLALARKIVQHGHKRAVAEAAANELAKKGLINEMALLKREVNRCVKKLWGQRRIRSYLWTRGYGKDALDSLDDLLLDIEFSEVCAELIRKQCGSLPKDPEERQKLKAKLVRYGYSPEEIRQAFRLLSE